MPLKLIRRDERPATTIFVHGLDFVGSGFDLEEITAHIHAARVPGAVYAYEWDSTYLSLERLIDPRAVRPAERAGIALARTIRRMQAEGKRHWTLVGHSIGTFVIACALQWLADRDAEVDAVVLFAGTVAAEAAYWNELSRAVTERVVNFYSKNDWHAGQLAGAAGSVPIRARNGKFVNVRCDLTHCDYWSEVRSLLPSARIRRPSQATSRAAE